MRRTVPEALRARLARPARVLLGTHEHPDADGLGSLVALGLVLAARGHDVARVRSHAIPEAVAALPGVAAIAEADVETPYEIGILFDCHDPSRLGVEAEVFSRAAWTTCIDHHPPQTASVLSDPWIVDDAPATALLVLALIRDLHGDAAVTEDVANCLYAGLITDTGGFRHENTTAEALTAGAFLVERGARAAELAESLLHRRRVEGLDLLARALASVSLHADGKVAHVVIDPAMLEASGARDEETEGIVGHLSSIEGVELAALIKADGDAHWRVSLRGNGGCSVDEIAREFGGGGHQRAAAFAWQQPLDMLLPRLLDRLADRARECGGQA